MKKFLLVIVAAVLVVSLVGCDSGREQVIVWGTGDVEDQLELPADATVLPAPSETEAPEEEEVYGRIDARTFSISTIIGNGEYALYFMPKRIDEANNDTKGNGTVMMLYSDGTTALIDVVSSNYRFEDRDDMIECCRGLTAWISKDHEGAAVAGTWLIEDNGFSTKGDDSLHRFVRQEIVLVEDPEIDAKDVVPEGFGNSWGWDFQALTRRHNGRILRHRIEVNSAVADGYYFVGVVDDAGELDIDITVSSF